MENFDKYLLFTASKSGLVLTPLPIMEFFIISLFLALKAALEALMLYVILSVCVIML